MPNPEGSQGRQWLAVNYKVFAAVLDDKPASLADGENCSALGCFGWLCRSGPHFSPESLAPLFAF